MKTSNTYKDQIEAFLVKGKNYHNPSFSAKRLAEMVGVSPYKLSRILKREFGMSYTDIVHAYRIQDAKRYLKDKRLESVSVDDIGAMVGFHNRQSFFEAFRNTTGTTPDKFRNA